MVVPRCDMSWWTTGDGDPLPTLWRMVIPSSSLIIRYYWNYLYGVRFWSPIPFPKWNFFVGYFCIKKSSLLRTWRSMESLAHLDAHSARNQKKASPISSSYVITPYLLGLLPWVLSSLKLDFPFLFLLAEFIFKLPLGQKILQRILVGSPKIYLLENLAVKE